MVHIYLPYIYCSEIYFCSIYILVINIFNAWLKVMVHIYVIYIAHEDIFDASRLWKEMVDILLLTLLWLSQVAPSEVNVSGTFSYGCQWYTSLCPWLIAWRTEFLLKLQQLDLNNDDLKLGTWSLGLVVLKHSNWNPPQSAKWYTGGDTKSRIFWWFYSYRLPHTFNEWLKCTPNTENHIQYHQ